MEIIQFKLELRSGDKIARRSQDLAFPRAFITVSENGTKISEV